MSLIVVFLAICSRLGVPASPVAFPMQVIVRVHTQADCTPAEDDIFVDSRNGESGREVVIEEA